MNALAKNAGGLWIAVGVGAGTALGVVLGLRVGGSRDRRRASASSPASSRAASAADCRSTVREEIPCTNRLDRLRAVPSRVAVAFIVATTGELPERVASHFGPATCRTAG